MSVIRSFIAIEITPEIQERLQKVVDQLQVELPEGVVRWVPATNMHLTLKFLGDVSLANLDILKEILQSEAGHHKPFEISVGSLGAFPSARRARRDLDRCASASGIKRHPKRDRKRDGAPGLCPRRESVLRTLDSRPGGAQCPARGCASIGRCAVQNQGRISRCGHDPSDTSFPK